MGKYFNPPTDTELLEAGGRQIEASSYAESQNKLQTRELLIGLFDCGMYCCAPLIDSQEEWDWQMTQEQTFLGLFAVPADEAAKRISR
ncbi:MAG: hypothetical protein BV459_06665 [Thermoplasmata archaeon M11B2D]|nr:MAG: hypothetical protein BV459_06665 [Thermoplasmata archaeon M11B2D]PNX51199.1 MAG: hypothetical protein BV458_11835 [Thermoplasmata archaeon M9B2D]